MALALVSDEHHAEDVVQDAWVRALESGPRDQGALGAWMATVTRRLSFNKKRSHRRRGHRERNVARAESLPSSAEIAERVEIETHLLAALDQLREPHRTALRDRYLGDLTPAEIAQRDGVSLNTIKSRLSRARAAMREQLERDGLGGEVQWSVFVAPLLEPRGTWASASAAAPAGPSITGVSRVGGTLLMKKNLGILGLVLLATISWQLVQPLERDALDRADQIAVVLDAHDELARVEGESSITSETSTRVALSDSIEGTSPTAAVLERPWKVKGGARLARSAEGVQGVVFDLAVHAGYDTDGKLLHEERGVTGTDGGVEWILEEPGGTVTLTVQTHDTVDQVVVSYGPYLIINGEEVPLIDALVFPIDGRLVGTVRDAEGSPVAGAMVEGYFGETKTSHSGEYEMRIATDGWGAIEANAKGHGGDSHELQDLVAGATTRVDFTLTQAIRIEGVVRDRTGAPIAGARVQASGRLNDLALTDPAGHYELSSVDYIPGEKVWATVRAEGFGTQGAFLDVFVDQFEYELNFELQRGVPVTGRIVEGDGRPVAGAKVWIGPQQHSWKGTTAVSRDDGRFRFDSVAPGHQQAGAMKGGFAPAQVAVTVPAHGISEEILLEFPDARTVRGTVRDKQGRPLAGANVSARQNSEYVGGRGRSDEKGVFEVGSLPKGRVHLEVFTHGFVRTTVPVAPNESEAEIVMPRAGKSAGRVIDATTGDPLTGFTVRFMFPTGPESKPSVVGFNANWSKPGRTFHDADGRWATGGDDEFQVGAWIGVEIRAAGYARTLHDVQVVAADAELTLVHELVPPVTLEIALTIEGGGDPVSNAKVEATTVAHAEGEDLRWNATTDRLGSVVFRDVSPGPLHVTVVRQGGFPLKYGPFEIATTPARSFLPIELPAGRTLEVLLLDESGQALPNRRVQISTMLEGTGQYFLHGVTNEGGLTTIEQVPLGRWRVSRMLEQGISRCHELTGSIEVTRSDDVARLVLQTPGHTVVRGTVNADDPIPADCTVTAISRDGALGHGAFVREGEFEFRGLASGSYLITLSCWDVGASSILRGRSELLVGEGDTERTLELEVKPLGD